MGTLSLTGKFPVLGTLSLTGKFPVLGILTLTEKSPVPVQRSFRQTQTLPVQYRRIIIVYQNSPTGEISFDKMNKYSFASGIHRAVSPWKISIIKGFVSRVSLTTYNAMQIIYLIFVKVESPLNDVQCAQRLTVLHSLLYLHRDYYVGNKLLILQ